MSNIDTRTLSSAQLALDQLNVITMKAARGETLSHDEIQVLRATADHAGREAAANLGLLYDGEPVEKHDRLEWVDMLTYVADPF